MIPYASLAMSLFSHPSLPRNREHASARLGAQAGKPHFPALRYNIAVLKGDQEQMDRAVGLARAKRGPEHWMAHEQALALARSGRLRAARRLSNRAVELALQEPGREAAASDQAARAVWESVCGNAVEGKTNAMTALELSEGRDVEYAAAFALGFSGSSSRSEALAGDLEKRFPEDTFVKFTYAPVLRALAALGRGKPEDSVERLEIARPYELAVNGLNFNHFNLGGLHSAYVRGEALIAVHRYAEAAAEFQKILDHRGSWRGSHRRPGALATGCAFAFREIRARRRLPMRTSSQFGKMPAGTYRFSRRQGAVSKRQGDYGVTIASIPYAGCGGRPALSAVTTIPKTAAEDDAHAGGTRGGFPTAPRGR